MKKLWSSQGYQTDSVIEALMETCDRDKDGDEYLSYFASPDGFSEWLEDNFSVDHFFEMIPIEEQLKIYGEYAQDTIKDIIYNWGGVQLTTQEDESLFSLILNNQYVLSDEELALQILQWVKNNIKALRSWGKKEIDFQKVVTDEIDYLRTLDDKDLLTPFNWADGKEVEHND